VIALVDCNNFYASCERLFQPRLRGKPIVVLSNNDGCVVARSDEAKAAGVAMGVPLHEIKELVRTAGIHVFSSNYTLYGDISARVAEILRENSPRLEVYSIDEAFSDLTGIKDLREWGFRVRGQILCEVGIPVCVGVARSKTLAKAANRVAKKFKDKTAGVHVLDSVELEEKALRWLKVDDVWGVGHATAKKLQLRGVSTAWDFAQLPEPWVRKTLGVVGARMWTELRGIPSQGLMELEATRKSLMTSRSFERTIGTLEEVEQAVASFASKTAAKLRTRKLCASGLSVFLQTNPFASSGPKFSGARAGGLQVPTNDTREVVGLALALARMQFQQGYLYKKAGVEALDLVPDNAVQGGLFDVVDRPLMARLQAAQDRMVVRYGPGAVRLGVLGNGSAVRMRREHISKRYTTSWDELLEIEID
jgi:DNA polymerase V